MWTEPQLNEIEWSMIDWIVIQLNIITTDPFNIVNEQRRFDQELYTGRNENNEAIESFLRDQLSIPKL